MELTDLIVSFTEGFWSLPKRGISRVYHAASHKCLQSYLDEYVFRYNQREDDAPMCAVMASQIGTSDTSPTTRL